MYYLRVSKRIDNKTSIGEFLTFSEATKIGYRVYSVAAYQLRKKSTMDGLSLVKSSNKNFDKVNGKRFLKPEYELLYLPGYWWFINKR